MKRSMGLDIGTRTIGVATSDLLGMIAGGVETIRRTTEERDFERIGELIKEHEVDTVVLGYPKNMNGTIGERAERCQQFAACLKEKTNLPTVLWDERSTTVTAHQYLNQTNTRGKKRKAVVDTVAATIILESYLAYRKHHPEDCSEH